MMTNLAIPSSASAAANAAAVASSSTANSGSATGSGSSGTLTQSDFLQLLTAQLKYQTPNNPADPTQMASEFADISTVDGINQLNSSVNKIGSSTAAGQIAEASSLVGKQVAVSGNVMTPNTAGNAVGGFSLNAAAQDVQVSVLSPSGAVTDTIDLGALPAGQQNFSWSGGEAGTQYTYQVSAVSASGASVSATPYSIYTVAGVNVSGTSPTLDIQGSSLTVPLSSVQTVFGVSS